MRWPSRLRSALRFLSCPVYDGLDGTRTLIFAESSLVQVIATFTTGAFLTGYLKQMGVSDAAAAVIIQLPLLVSFVQLFAPLFYEKRSHRLPYLRGFAVGFRLLLTLSFLVTLWLPSSKGSVALFIAIYLLAYMVGYFADPAYLDFLSELLPKDMRAKFFATRDILLILSGTIASVLGSLMLDHFTNAGTPRTGFALSSISSLAATGLLFLTYRRMKAPAATRETAALRLGKSLRLPFQDRAYRRFMAVNALHFIGFYFCSAFSSLYMISGLGLSFIYVSFIGLLGTFMRIFTARIWSGVLQRHGSARVMSCSLLIYAISLGVICIATKDSYSVIMPVSGLLGGVGAAGTNIGLLDLNVTSAPDKNRTAYFSMNAFLTPFVGLLSGLLGAALCARLEGVTWYMGELPMSNMQTIFLIAGVYFTLFSAAAVLMLRNRKTSHKEDNADDLGSDLQP